MAKKISAGSEPEDSLRLGGQGYKEESGGKMKRSSQGRTTRRVCLYGIPVKNVFPGALCN